MANPTRSLAGIVILAAAFAAGVIWNAPVRRVLGLDAGHSPEAKPATSQKQLWTCSMHPQVIKDAPGRCPICHMELVPLKAGAPTAPSDAAAPAAVPAERKIKFWWDPAMTPPFTSDQPGRSPTGAALVPVYEDEAGPAGAEITVDPAMVQNLGVRTAVVTEGPLTHTVRAVGTLEEAQPNIRDINLRVSGWVRKVYITSEGEHLEAGAPLFDLYSPELQLAIQELIAMRQGQPSSDSGSLAEAAARKLELLGLDRAQIDALSKADKAPDTITFKSPISGHVTEKLIVEGDAVKSGDRVLRIVDHTTLWIDAQVFERDLPFIKVGATASATVASRPRNVYDGKIIFIHPHVDPTTRAAVARLEVHNAGLALKPGMYATVLLESLAAERAVLAPREAIIDSGDAQVALIALGAGHFQAQRVKVGLAADHGMIQIVAGLAAGDQVVTSGQFLLDSESRLRESLQKFLSPTVPEGGGKGGGAQSPEMPSRAGGPDVPTGAPNFTPTQSAKLDAAVRAYLDISDALGAVQKDAKAIDADPLVAASHELHQAVMGTALESPVIAAARSAEAMRGKVIDEQREAFKDLSEKFIALITAAPPSRAVGEKLFLMECPMAPGHWIQRTDELANPFYGAEMKECGSHSGVITTRITGEAKP